VGGRGAKKHGKNMAQAGVQRSMTLKNSQQARTWNGEKVQGKNALGSITNAKTRGSLAKKRNSKSRRSNRAVKENQNPSKKKDKNFKNGLSPVNFFKGSISR